MQGDKGVFLTAIPSIPMQGDLGGLLSHFSLPTQGGLEGLLPQKIPPISNQATNRIIHHIIGITPSSGKDELREFYCAGEGNREQQYL